VNVLIRLVIELFLLIRVSCERALIVGLSRERITHGIALLMVALAIYWSACLSVARLRAGLLLRKWLPTHGHGTESVLFIGCRFIDYQIFASIICIWLNVRHHKSFFRSLILCAINLVHINIQIFLFFFICRLLPLKWISSRLITALSLEWVLSLW
jgi:hypothetical protein